MNLDGLFARSERILKTRNQQEVNKAAREAAKLREVARREAEAAGIVLDDDELDVLEDDEYSDDYEDPLATDDEDDAGEKESGAKAGPKAVLRRVQIAPRPLLLRLLVCRKLLRWRSWRTTRVRQWRLLR